MLYTAKEIESNFSLSERMKLEKLKIQNSPVYWMNEFISASIPGAHDIESLVNYSRNITEQLVTLYEDLEPLLKKTPDLVELNGYIQSLEEQVESLYKEKEEAFKAFEGISSIADLVKLAKEMQEKLKTPSEIAEISN